ncbi:hypothetical protein SAMD00019534_122830, partial [Acytostelium subglobosum LB1]|uniref:hypothetical protein n=1 Tax=Acytostelium subglobosum LB1 TaxID=1410327 RepID=UPI0006448ADB
SIIIDVNSGKLTIQQMVEDLGDHLQSTDTLTRARGTLLLSEVLCRLPQLKLNEGQVHFLSMFYYDRLKDFACASEVVKGVFGLVINHKVPYPNNQKILRAIFQEVHPTTLAQTHRKMVLQIIDFMLLHNLAEVQELKGDFMSGFIQFIDNEKDPRNLIFTFMLIPKVILYIPEYKSFADSLFEIISCYFPISFNPKPGDPNGITKEALVTALLNCFSASTFFAEHSIPFLIDKICSNVVDTKVESLKTLTYCCDKYGPVTIRPFLEDIWSTLRSQILTQKSAIVIEESKKTIFYLTRNISSDPETLESFLKMIDKECLHHIKTSQDSKIAVSCASILFQTISSCVKASRIVLSHVLPELMDFFQELALQLSDDPIHKSNEQLSVVALFNDIFKANNISFLLHHQHQHTSGDEINPIEKYEDRLYKLLIGLLSNSSLSVRTLAVDCLANLYISQLKHSSPPTFVLSQDKRQDIIKSLIAFLNDSDDKQREKSLEALMSITKLEQVEQMNNYAIPTLLQMINVNQSKSVKESKHYLEAFSMLCTHQPLLQSVIPQIKTLLNHNIKQQYTSEEEFQNCLLVVENLEHTFAKSIDEQTMTLCYRDILFPLIKELFEQVLLPSTTGSSGANIGHNNKIMTPSLSMIHAIIQNTSKEPSKLQAMNALVWLTKAFVTNGNPINITLGNTLAQLISNKQQDAQISQLAAKSFNNILAEDHELFSQHSGAVIKILHKQKFFAIMFPTLLESFKEYQQSNNVAISSQYLVAITNMLRNVPKEVLLSELTEVLPIVLHSLQSNQADLLNSSLQTLSMLVEEAPTSLSSHIDSLIPTLIRISTTGESLNFRKSSLEVLTRISRDIAYPKIYPFRNQVINGIVPCLDDKKRLVRKEATRCRNSWFILQTN